MPVYQADSFSIPVRTEPETGSIKNYFTATCKTMLNGAAGFLINDVIELSVIPGGCTLDDYYVDVAELDTSTGITLDLGDNDILTGATTGQVSGAQTTPALASTSFTLTLAASTASFTAAGIVMVGGVLIAHSGVSGSTLTGCYCAQTNLVLPDKAIVQDAANFGGFQAASVIGQGAEGWMFPEGNATGTTYTTATLAAAALPKSYPNPVTSGFALPPGKIIADFAPLVFLLRVHATATANPTYTTQVIKGWISYAMRGYYQ